MKFSSDSDASHDEPAIGIEFRERLGSWLFSLQGGRDKKVPFVLHKVKMSPIERMATLSQILHNNTHTLQIYQEDVSFWDYPTPFYLKEMCQEKLYPPRFSVRIRGVARPDDVVRAEFTFPGAVAFPGRGEPVAIIHLPLPTQISKSSLSTGMCSINR